MPAWHRHVLTLATLLASVGIVGHARQHLATTSSDGTNVGNLNSSGAVATPHSSYTGEGSTPAQPTLAPADQPVASSQQPWYLSPQFLNVGGSVIGGFLIGWFARMFLKTVSLLVLAGGAILAALSYFHVVNVDLTAANTQYTSAMHWLTDQGSRLKDVAIAYLPVHAAGAFGTFLGFQRR